jgi:hypothetical protein
LFDDTRIGIQPGSDGRVWGCCDSRGRQESRDVYRQKYYKGKAEDKAAVITVGKEQVQVSFG